MRLRQLTYARRLKTKADPSELSRIQQQAAEHNQKCGFTGIIHFDNDMFLQSLEVDRENDLRHSRTLIAFR